MRLWTFSAGSARLRVESAPARFSLVPACSHAMAEIDQCHADGDELKYRDGGHR